MDIVGYLITLLNLEALGGGSRGQISDLSIKVENVASLANDLKLVPNFTVNDFKETGYCRKGEFGVYLSNSLRDYLFNNGDPSQEGTIIFFFYEYPSSKTRNIDSVHSYIIRKHEGFHEDAVNAVIDKYLLKI